MDEAQRIGTIDCEAREDPDALLRQAIAERLRSEEPLNTLTHAIGFVLSIVGVAWLTSSVYRTGDHWQLAACAAYGASLIAVYAASTLSHVFSDHPRLRRVFRTLDQACIFLLIAGTFTPIAVTYLRASWWPSLLVLMWTCAAAGFLSKTVLGHQIEGATTAAQVAMGWLPVLAVRPMLALAPSGLLLWVFAGGVCYTVGTLFLHRDARYPRFHAIWHLWVIAGSACHFIALLRYCTVAIG